MKFEGGCTLVFDLRREAVRYCIRKNIHSQARALRQQNFVLENSQLQICGPTANGSPFGDEPFATIHQAYQLKHIKTPT